MSRAAAPNIEMFAEIQKIDAKTRTVFGYASTETRDRQGEIVTRDAIHKALPGYMLWKNVREMHQPSAVGTAIEAAMDPKGLWFGCHVSDDRAWKKVEDRVYKGFSIGGRVTARDPLDKSIVTGVDITEISLVDRPANPDARFELIKRAGDHLMMQPTQYWGCGCSDHQHLGKTEAQQCMADQAEALHKRWDAAQDVINTVLVKFNPHHGEHGHFAEADTAKSDATYHVGFKHNDMDMVHIVGAKTPEEAMKEFHATYGHDQPYEPHVVKDTGRPPPRPSGNTQENYTKAATAPAESNVKMYDRAVALAQHHEGMATAHRVASADGNTDHAGAATAHERAAVQYRQASKHYTTNDALIGDAYRNAGYMHGMSANKTSADMGVMRKFEDLAKMPVSEAQRRAMWAAKEGHSTLGISEKVGADFANKDPGGKLPKKVKDGKPVHEDVEKREFSDTQREHAASTGAAMPGGGYPIENTGDLRNAIHAFGRAKDPDATKAHIKSRAKALGAESMLPEEWSKAEATDDLGKATPRAIDGGKFAGHLKSADEAAAMAMDHHEKSMRFAKLQSRHQSLSDESAAAGNTQGMIAHRAIARSHGALAAHHEKLADKYTRLAGKHGDWAQKMLSADTSVVVIAKQALAAKLQKYNSNNRLTA